MAISLLRYSAAFIGEDVVFSDGWEMKTVFQDFGKNMVGKRYFQH